MSLDESPELWTPAQVATHLGVTRQAVAEVAASAAVVIGRDDRGDHLRYLPSVVRRIARIRAVARAARANAAAELAALGSYEKIFAEHELDSALAALDMLVKADS